MAASRRLMKELEEIHKCEMKNFRNIQVDEANLLTWQGGPSESKSSTYSNHRRSHLKQRSITRTSTKRGRSVLLKTGSQQRKPTK
uniref:UBC core domain-containing protein n=1 Tax=Nomascus leucogenys TaxID=61853 RepID=A0A2I3GK15_NOMLE